ncbi:TRAPPC11 [Lepeophtheirus salmonis]|uniref:TRAPPC11 n=1 Tax=Lepeophtheirus salmonis TaxID=72036 RepID=A0A7R8CYZ4_LEPSM|nr:TRAPPC11 [Lepeophtheirus salmonis]CAF2972510.1 TRAPPC11 [Lepeophtheirus salmonis]
MDKKALFWDYSYPIQPCESLMCKEKYGILENQMRKEKLDNMKLGSHDDSYGPDPHLEDSAGDNNKAQFPRGSHCQTLCPHWFFGPEFGATHNMEHFFGVSSRLRFVNMENLEFSGPETQTDNLRLLDWKHPNWSEKILEVASKVKSVRGTLSGRGTKLAPPMKTPKGRHPYVQPVNYLLDLFLLFQSRQILCEVMLDAIAQFRKHADVFRHKVGCDRLAFEHSAWQSQQCHVFAQLFEKTISSSSGNNAASQAQHPGVYYQQAASHAISRRQQSEEAIQEEPNNFENVNMNLLENADHLEYYGQRPWRPGKATLEPPDKSISIFEMFKSPRMTAHLTVEVAEELRKEHQYRESLELLKPVIKTYRQEKWSFLLNSVLSLSLKCSFLICAIPEYASLCLELGSLEIQYVSQEEKNRITGNLIKLLERQCPSAEPGLTSKSERAAVTEAFPLWTSNLEYNQNTETPLIDLQSISSSSFNIKVTFENQEPVTVNSPGKCRLRLVNTGTNFPVPVQGVEISINDWSIDRKFNELVFVGPCSYLDEMFELKLQQSDIDLGKFSIVSVVVTIGNAILNIMNEPRRHKGCGSSKNSFASNESARKNPILVGEWFKIKLDFFNEEDSKIEDFECKTILLDSQDPLIGDTTSVSYDPSSQLEIKSPTDENVEAYAVTKHIGELESSKSLSFNVFLKASTTGIRNVRIRIKYKIGDEFYYTLKQNLSLNAIEPFVISTEFLSVRQRNISRIYTDEPFLCIPEVRSLCSGSIRILDCRIEPRFQLKNILKEKTTLDLFSFKPFHSPYGVKKSPFILTYKLSNLTDKVQEYSLNIESSEYFLISGNKQVHFKIIPHQSRTVNYVLHPVKAGPKVPLPKLNLKSLRLAQGLDVNETLERLLPEYMIVLENTHKDGFVKGQIRDELGKVACLSLTANLVFKTKYFKVIILFINNMGCFKMDEDNETSNLLSPDREKRTGNRGKPKSLDILIVSTYIGDTQVNPWTLLQKRYSFWGKFKTIFYISIVYAVGQAILTFGSIPDESNWTNLPREWLSYIGLLLIAFGTGGIKPCVVSFGADQFKLPEQQKELDTFLMFFMLPLT